MSFRPFVLVPHFLFRNTLADAPFVFAQARGRSTAADAVEGELVAIAQDYYNNPNALNFHKQVSTNAFFGQASSRYWWDVSGRAPCNLG